MDLKIAKIAVAARLPPGLYRHHSVEEAERQRKVWEEADFQALWVRRGLRPEEVGRGGVAPAHAASRRNSTCPD
jgi:hypothetical protein